MFNIINTSWKSIKPCLCILKQGLTLLWAESKRPRALWADLSRCSALSRSGDKIQSVVISFPLTHSLSRDQYISRREPRVNTFEINSSLIFDDFDDWLLTGCQRLCLHHAQCLPLLQHCPRSSSSSSCMNVISRWSLSLFSPSSLPLPTCAIWGSGIKPRLMIMINDHWPCEDDGVKKIDVGW